jgi:hypothetical protein
MSENGAECLNEIREMDIQDGHTSWPSTFKDGCDDSTRGGSALVKQASQGPRFICSSVVEFCMNGCECKSMVSTMTEFLNSCQCGTNTSSAGDDSDK